MQVIIIGAGRGSRLMPHTADTPKCFAEVEGKRILDWSLEAFRSNGLDRFCFIGGYQINKVQADYPEFEFRHNATWEQNNILASLMHAEDRMQHGFICCYSDILFTPNIVEKLLNSPADIALGVDTGWLDRYEHRTEHPSDDAEKVTVEGGLVTRVHRNIPEADAYGEFIGVAKFSPKGAQLLRDAYHRALGQHQGQPYREAKVFEKAYFIHLLQDMIEQGIPMHHEDTPGGYIEVDTQQDFAYARHNWTAKHSGR
jgi:choline kinase